MDKPLIDFYCCLCMNQECQHKEGTKCDICLCIIGKSVSIKEMKHFG